MLFDPVRGRIRWWFVAHPPISLGVTHSKRLRRFDEFVVLRVRGVLCTVANGKVMLLMKVGRRNYSSIHYLCHPSAQQGI